MSRSQQNIESVVLDAVVDVLVDVVEGVLCATAGGVHFDVVVTVVKPKKKKIFLCSDAIRLKFVNLDSLECRLPDLKATAVIQNASKDQEELQVQNPKTIDKRWRGGDCSSDC